MSDTPAERSDDTPRPIRSLFDLEAPRRPSDVSYVEGEDVDAEALLTSNGYSTDVEALIALLDSDIGIIQGAAARTLGARRVPEAREKLERLARDPDALETTRAQAAYALARMDFDGARDVLYELLELPFEASPGPVTAAGALARLGDPRGFPVVRAALDSSNPVTAKAALKQLYSFATLDGRQIGESDVVDLYGVYRRALDRPEQGMASEAKSQLEALGTDRARRLLQSN